MVTDTPLLGQAFPAKPGLPPVGAPLVALAIATVFAIDCFTSLGFGVPFFYVLILWVALARATPRQALAMTAASSMLTVIGLFLSPGDGLRMDLTNRAITLAALWFLAYSGMIYRKTVDILCRRERELTDFVENAPVGIHWVDPDGTILWANQEELDMLGYGREEYTGHCVVEFHVDREVAEDILEKLNANVPLKDRAARLRHKDGSIRHVLISCNVYREDGRFIHSRCFTQDITDRVRAELAQSESVQLAAGNARLHESKERLNFALRTSHTGGWDLNLADHTAYRTLEHDRIFGYDSLLPQWTYEMFLEHVLHEDRAEVDRRFREAIATQTEWSFECRIRRVDGEVRWIWATGEHQRDEAGQTRRMAGIVQDITEHKLAEGALRQSQEMYATLVNSIDGIVWEADARTLRFSFVSRQAERLLGYPVERWLNEPDFWKDHIHPDDREWAVDCCVTAIREKRAHDFEYRMLTTDRRTVWVRDIVNISVEHDQPVRLRGIIVDITKRKLAEKALQESEERFALFMHHLPNAAAFIKDVEGRYVYANPVTERAMRTQPGGWRGRTDDDMYPPAAAQQFKASDQRAISTPGAIETVETLCNGDEIQHWLVSKFPIPGNTSPSPLLGGIAIDITMIKRTEEALVASEQRLHQLFEERERLSRDLHDNIIQSIYGIGMRLETCRRLLYDRPQDVATHLTQIIRGLNSVIHDVRHYISSSEPQIPSKARLYAELERLIQPHTIGAPCFSVKLDPLAVARLTPWQAEHLRHIAREATSNTLRHSHARHVSLSLENMDGAVRLEISDDGAGFDPGIARRNHSGLQNMDFRAQQIGGRLEFLSSPGHGATITLHIPKEQPAHDLR